MMCLTFFCVDVFKDMPLHVLFNRDEWFERPTAKLHVWDTIPGIVAGRDLLRGGTWAGVTHEGRFACLTSEVVSGLRGRSPRSRGKLVTDFLSGTDYAENFLEDILRDLQSYTGFNLVAGDKHGLFHISTMSRKITRLERGIHGLSNADLNTDWPKVTVGKNRLEELLSVNSITEEDIFNLMTNPDFFGETRDNWSYSNQIFVRDEGYGTRATSSMCFLKDDKIKLTEWQHEVVNTSAQTTRLTLEC